MRFNIPLALLALVFMASVSAVWAVENFTPFETPATITASSSSSSTAFTLGSAIGAPDVKVCNQGTVIAYWACGSSAVTACLPGAGCASTQIGAGLCGIYHKGQGSTTCAAITPSGTTPVAFTAGQGQ